MADEEDEASNRDAAKCHDESRRALKGESWRSRGQIRGRKITQEGGEEKQGRGVMR